MRRIRLAYRDNDRTPVIFSIREMARRHYDIDVEVLQIKETEEYEEALFDGVCDVIIEHLEYLFERVANGQKITLFCAPSRGAGLHLVVPKEVSSVGDLEGKTLAIRASGQPHAIILWLRLMSLDGKVKTVLVKDKEVGRWGQWRKVAGGECVATFMSPLYLPAALAAGLKVLSVPEVPIVGHYAQACLSRFAKENSALLRDYVKAIVHALCWMALRQEEAVEFALGEPRKRMGIEDVEEFKRQFGCIVNGLKIKPYPTLQAVANSYEIATLEYRAAKNLNPLSLWDLHWVKELDDEGFIDHLVSPSGMVETPRL